MRGASGDVAESRDDFGSDKSQIEKHAEESQIEKTIDSVLAFLPVTDKLVTARIKANARLESFGLGLKAKMDTTTIAGKNPFDNPVFNNRAKQKQEEFLLKEKQFAPEEGRFRTKQKLVDDRQKVLNDTAANLDRRATKNAARTEQREVEKQLGFDDVPDGNRLQSPRLEGKQPAVNVHNNNPPLNLQQQDDLQQLRHGQSNQNLLVEEDHNLIVEEQREENLLENGQIRNLDNSVDVEGNELFTTSVNDHGSDLSDEDYNKLNSQQKDEYLAQESNDVELKRAKVEGEKARFESSPAKAQVDAERAGIEARRRELDAEKEKLKDPATYIIDMATVTIAGIDVGAGLGMPNPGSDFGNCQAFWQAAGDDLNSAKPNEDDWSGAAADKYIAQIDALYSNVLTMKSLDSKMETDLSAQAEKVEQLHSGCATAITALMAMRPIAVVLYGIPGSGPALSNAFQTLVTAAASAPVFKYLQDTKDSAISVANSVQSTTISYASIISTITAMDGADDSKISAFPTYSPTVTVNPDALRALQTTMIDAAAQVQSAFDGLPDNLATNVRKSHGSFSKESSDQVCDGASAGGPAARAGAVSQRQDACEAIQGVCAALASKLGSAADRYQGASEQAKADLNQIV